MSTPAYTNIKKLVPVPEAVLKSRKFKSAERKARVEARLASKAAAKVRRAQAIKRAEQYINEYNQQEKELVALRRTAKSAGNFFVEPEAKLAVVIRLRGLHDIPPKPRKALQLLRLRQVNNAVFVRLNKASLAMLKLVEPYVAWGYPTLQTVRNLIYKRGFAKVEGNRLPITNNAMIEQNLGKSNVVCIEDIVHEIFTVGPNFKAVNNFLWPFKLHPARGGLRSKKRHYADGGSFGNSEKYINGLVRQML